ARLRADQLARDQPALEAALEARAIRLPGDVAPPQAGARRRDLAPEQPALELDVLEILVDPDARGVGLPHPPHVGGHDPEVQAAFVALPRVGPRDVHALAA